MLQMQRIEPAAVISAFGTHYAKKKNRNARLECKVVIEFLPWNMPPIARRHPRLHPVSHGSVMTMKLLAEAETTLEIEHRILERIGGRVRNLRVVRSGERMILEGSSGSFHAKQLATHAAL